MRVILYNLHFFLLINIIVERQGYSKQYRGYLLFKESTISLADRRKVHFKFAIVSLSAEHRMSTCFTRDVLTGCILHEQMISFESLTTRQANFCIRAPVSPKRDPHLIGKPRYISRCAKASSASISRTLARHEFQLPPLGIALVLLPATRRTNGTCVISKFYRKCLMRVPIYVLTIFEIHFNLVGLRYLWSDIYSTFIKSIQIKRENVHF